MEKDTAIALFTHFESATFAFENDNADSDDWVDDNTPPTEHLPTYSVRFDAGINRKDERDYRLRILVGTLAPSMVDAIAAVMERAKEADVGVEIQNNGIELA